MQVPDGVAATSTAAVLRQALPSDGPGSLSYCGSVGQGQIEISPPEPKPDYLADPLLIACTGAPDLTVVALKR
jgi:hypothetical protein